MAERANPNFDLFNVNKSTVSPVYQGGEEGCIDSALLCKALVPCEQEAGACLLACLQAAPQCPGPVLRPVEEREPVREIGRRECMYESVCETMSPWSKNTGDIRV